MIRRHKIAVLSLLSLPVVMLLTSGGSVAAAHSGARAARSAVASSSLGSFAPTFVGTAATGCASGCDLLTGPFPTPSVAGMTAAGAAPGHVAASQARLHAMPFMQRKVPAQSQNSSTVALPSVSCEPLRAGCDSISSFAGGALGVKGINAVDSAQHTTNPFSDVEPPDQGLCAGNGHVVETNNIGEILIFNQALNRVSPVISLDRIMGLGKRHWSSGGDPSCLYDSSNGGHWFFTEFVSASPESKGGPFAGCFAAVANTCYEGIAVSKGSSPFGPYNVYFMNGNFNPAEPGYPSLLNDYVKISATRDAFLLFYDEFPQGSPGLGGGAFNGAQQFAFNKTALENGDPVFLSNGNPNPAVTVAYENMGLLSTPNGTCFSDNKYFQPGIACWFSVIPAVPPGPAQWDNTHGGTGFMLATLDFYNLGGNRLAVFDWTGLKNLNSAGCAGCSGIRFGGQLFTGLNPYYNAFNPITGTPAAQKAGPIPLGNRCGAAGLSTNNVKHCPEGGIATNSDQVTQASQADGQLWAGVNTKIVQKFSSTNVPEEHMGAAYWVVGTSSFDNGGSLTLTNQGYVSPAHEDIEFPAIAAGASNGRAIMSFTLNGNGGVFGFDGGGFYPSSAFGRLTSSSSGLLQRTINIADLGQSPQDGFSEYQGYPTGLIQPRWGDYGNAIYMGGKVYFASEYIQYPNCTGASFTLTVGTCGGTRDGFANWGTSVNSVTP